MADVNLPVWLLVSVAVIAGAMFLFGFLPVFSAVGNFLRRIRRRPSLPLVPESQKASQIGLRGDLTRRYIPGPKHVTATPFVAFTTAGRIHEARTGKRPQALRFIKPTSRIVRRQDLPAEIPCGAGKLIIKAFTAEGFVVEEENTVGDEVRVEYYEPPKSSVEEIGAD